jgi:hypothetical protein
MRRSASKIESRGTVHFPASFETKPTISDDTLRSYSASADIRDQSYKQAGDIETPIELVRKRAEVFVSVLAALEGLVGAGSPRLEVSQDGVNPPELWQVPGLAMGHDILAVDAAGIRHYCEASRAVAKRGIVREQAGLGPLRDSHA